MNCISRLRSVARAPYSFLTTMLIVVTAAFSVSLAGVAFGQGAGSDSLTIYSAARPGAVSPDLYRPTQRSGNFSGQGVPGYAVIRHEREIVLEKERSEVHFSDVAAFIDPTTVSFKSLTDPDSTRVLEQNYQFDLVSPGKLMERYIDREITVEQGRGNSVETFTGTLMSAAGGLILKEKGGNIRVVKNYSNLLFPELPGGLITKPTLVWDVETSKPGPHRVQVTYQTSGITWWSDYNLILREGKDASKAKLDLSAWVSIINMSGASYHNANLKLIAGDVHRAPQAGGRIGGEMSLRSSRGARKFEEKAFFEYHLYTLTSPTTLPDNSTKQIELFPTARSVSARKELVYFGSPNYAGYYSEPMTGRNQGVGTGKVDVYLRFTNSKENHMGMPLPSGRIRVSKLDPADNTLEFIGEDVIDHTSKDEDILVKLGSAFDVVGERKQLNFKIDTARRWIEETIEIKIRNHKDKPVNVTVKETLFRWANWRITQSTHKYEKVDSRTISFPVGVKKDGETRLSFTARYTW